MCTNMYRRCTSTYAYAFIDMHTHTTIYMHIYKYTHTYKWIHVPKYVCINKKSFSECCCSLAACLPCLSASVYTYTHIYV